MSSKKNAAPVKGKSAVQTTGARIDTLVLNLNTAAFNLKSFAKQLKDVNKEFAKIDRATAVAFKQLNKQLEKASKGKPAPAVKGDAKAAVKAQIKKTVAKAKAPKIEAKPVAPVKNPTDVL